MQPAGGEERRGEERRREERRGWLAQFIVASVSVRTTHGGINIIGVGRRRKNIRARISASPGANLTRAARELSKTGRKEAAASATIVVKRPER